MGRDPEKERKKERKKDQRRERRSWIWQEQKIDSSNVDVSSQPLLLCFYLVRWCPTYYRFVVISLGNLLNMDDLKHVKNNPVESLNYGSDIKESGRETER